MTLFNDTAQEKYLNTIRRKHSSEYPLPFEQFKNFIKKHPLTMYRWQKVHYEVQCLIITSKHRRKEIHGRLQLLFYRETYKAQNKGKLPTESCTSRIKRIINKDPYPFKYDYELDILHKNEVLANLIQYYKIIFQYHFNINKKENPLIDNIKRNGDITPSSAIMCSRAPQIASTPTRSRSRVNSSCACGGSRVSRLLGEEEEDRSIHFSVTRTLTRTLAPKTVVIVKPVPSSSSSPSSLQVQHSYKLNQIMKSFHERDSTSLNKTSDIPGTVNE